MYERAPDGQEHDWAAILVYEPPHRVVLEWKVNSAAPPTEVEVRFTQDGDGTRVELEHRGWERTRGRRGRRARVVRLRLVARSRAVPRGSSG